MLPVDTGCVLSPGAPAAAPSAHEDRDSREQHLTPSAPWLVAATPPSDGGTLAAAGPESTACKRLPVKKALAPALRLALRLTLRPGWSSVPLPVPLALALVPAALELLSDDDDDLLSLTLTETYLGKRVYADTPGRG
jgi:hypothetical protein